MNMEMSTKHQLKIGLEDLNSICASPHVYLTNYFRSLRSEVDIEMLRKELIHEFNIEMHKKLKECWLQMITRIELFESESIQNSIDLSLLFTERLNSIRSQLENENQLVNLEKIKETIQTEEYNILKVLFNDRTIAFVNVKHLCEKPNQELLIDNKLVILNDGFIRTKIIKQKYSRLIWIRKFFISFNCSFY